MNHVFLDSSVLLSFCASKTGASALVMKYCREGKVKGHISEKVIAEVRKNTALKMGDRAVEQFAYILKEDFLIVEPDPQEHQVKRCRGIITAKDAPILAVALINSEIEYLLTLDAKDFLKPHVLRFAAPLKILTPGEFVKKYSKEA